MDKVELPQSDSKENSGNRQMSKGEEIYYFRKTFETELMKYRKESLILKGLYQCREKIQMEEETLSSYLCFIFKPLMLFYDEDLGELAKFIEKLTSTKFIWMRINVGDYGCTELHASEEGLKLLRASLKKMKELEGVYIFFWMDNWTWEWKSRINVLQQEIDKFYLELGHLKLLRVEYTFNF